MRNKKWKFIKQEIVKILSENLTEENFEREDKNKEIQDWLLTKLNKTQTIKFKSSLTSDSELNFKLKIIRPKKRINFLLVNFRTSNKRIGNWQAWTWFHKYPNLDIENFKFYEHFKYKSEFNLIREICNKISIIIEEGWTSEKIKENSK